MQEFRGVARELTPASGPKRPIDSKIHAKGGPDRNYMAAARERLLPLISEVNRYHVDDYASLLLQSATPEEFRQGMREQGGYGASYNQLLGPIMINLYKQDEEVRQAIRAKAGELGIPDKAIEMYFTGYITEGALAVNMFRDIAELIPAEKKKPFIELTDQLMLDALKRHAGLDKKQEG
jgi:hypothetical protein